MRREERARAKRQMLFSFVGRALSDDIQTITMPWRWAMPTLQKFIN